jgi:7,8-dihydropterin-6-yl-methyl-4-(beta-D-ribofuranosyl)aminobenzene 5'-phosphate synthase
MCADQGQFPLSAAVPHEGEVPEADSVEAVSLMDNVTDALMTGQGPARRPVPGNGPVRPDSVLAGGTVPDALVAEHGFSALVTVRAGQAAHRFLFDAGTARTG